MFREEWSWWPKIPIVRSILNGASSDVITEAMSTCLPPDHRLPLQLSDVGHSLTGKLLTRPQERS